MQSLHASTSSANREKQGQLLAMPTCGLQMRTFAMSMLPFSMAAFTRSFSACGGINQNGFDV